MVATDLKVKNKRNGRKSGKKQRKNNSKASKSNLTHINLLACSVWSGLVLHTRYTLKTKQHTQNIHRGQLLISSFLLFISLSLDIARVLFPHSAFFHTYSSV